jgi:hypothetical protein
MTFTLPVLASSLTPSVVSCPHRSRRRTAFGTQQPQPLGGHDQFNVGQDGPQPPEQRYDKPLVEPPRDRKSIKHGLNYAQRVVALLSFKNLGAGVKRAKDVFLGIKNGDFSYPSGRKPSFGVEVGFLALDLAMLTLTHGSIVLLELALPSLASCSQTYAAFYDGVNESAARQKTSNQPPDQPQS